MLSAESNLFKKSTKALTKAMPTAIQEELSSNSMNGEDGDSKETLERGSSEDSDNVKTKIKDIIKICNHCKKNILNQDYVKVSPVHLFHQECFTCNGHNCNKRLDKTEFYSLWPETREMYRMGSLTSKRSPSAIDKNFFLPKRTDNKKLTIAMNKI
jgi:hypothetical protein